MKKMLATVAAVALSSVSLALPAVAQDMTTMTFNGTTITLGGGFQFLSLPDIHFVGRGTPVGVVMGADQLQGIGVGRIRTAADLGIPPRWGPVRC